MLGGSTSRMSSPVLTLPVCAVATHRRGSGRHSQGRAKGPGPVHAVIMPS
jgi:hypothetical protein